MVIASIVLYKHTYDDLKDTLNCLSSSNAVKKIILVDNDHSDWANTYKNEKVVYLKSNGNFGFGYGHNFAIQKYADGGPLFLVCNPDIRFEQKEFENLVKYALAREEGLFLPKILYPNGENQFGARLLPTPMNLFSRRFSQKLAAKLDRKYLLQNFHIEKPVFAPYLSGCFMLFKSDALLNLNGFDERYFMYMEDIDLSRRCAEKFGALYCPQFFITHVHEKASYKSGLLLKAHIQSAFHYFNKWGWIYDPNRKILNKQCLKSISMQYEDVK
ncbi:MULTISPECIES: glycosyltransferase [Acinetobacter]|uniref:glycosyltransferase n=1 Tax=Acinetobacter TaxID=469 RepID=UPI000289BADC|nr:MULTISPECIES: glycosyltransferase family 2 protein [Acinetobacter]ENX16325.1 hypothetical protein F895_01526 [Acinetobacter sp. CIP 64.2]RSE36796.1 glycosyltransferase family 2 protein [Acinetobacter junii]